MIFNINFFLFSFAQSCIWSYLFVIAKHYANVTNAQFSILALILPALAFFAKPISCALTDAHGIHKQFVLGCYTVFTLSYSVLGALMVWKDPEDHEYDTIAWLVMSVCMACGYTATSCAFCLNDALASNYARKNDKSYSRMKIWSNVGWALGALLVMSIGNVSWLPFRFPGIIILVVAVLADIILLILWPYEEDFEMFHDGTTIEERKLSIVGPNTRAYLAQNRPRLSISKDMMERIKTGRSKSVGNLPRLNDKLRPLDLTPQLAKPESKQEEDEELKEYIFLFTCFGVVQGMIWTYQLDYVNLHITRDPAEFEFIANLCMIAQSFLGDIPTNAIATDLIKIFGANANLSLAFVSIGLRCFFYSELLPYLGPLYIVIAEGLQGPSLGLYWIVMVDVGSNYALMVNEFMPELKRRGIVRSRAHEEELSGCLRASMIGMMGSSMEGLGVALGSFFGGIISGSLGYFWMWNFCAMMSISLGFINIGWDVLTKLVFKRQSKKAKPNVGQIPTIQIEGLSKL